jgi:hypothetical protein
MNITRERGIFIGMYSFYGSDFGKAVVDIVYIGVKAV